MEISTIAILIVVLLGTFVGIIGSFMSVYYWHIWTDRSETETEDDPKPTVAECRETDFMYKQSVWYLLVAILGLIVLIAGTSFHVFANQLVL